MRLSLYNLCDFTYHSYHYGIIKALLKRDLARPSASQVYWSAARISLSLNTAHKKEKPPHPKVMDEVAKAMYGKSHFQALTVPIINPNYCLCFLCCLNYSRAWHLSKCRLSCQYFENSRLQAVG